jgi:uncharacterized protein (TIGR02466 family)
MKYRKLFPSLVLHTRLKLGPKAVNELIADLAQEIHKLSEVDTQGIKWSAKNYRGGYTSYGSLSELHKFSTTFGDLKISLDLLAKTMAQELEMDLQGRRLKLTNMWANKMPSGVVHTMHIHPLSVLSGTFYVETPKNCSALKFEDPRLLGFMASPPRRPKAREENQRFVSITPNAGDVIMFESWMRHEVPPNPATRDRLSISFNYDWV